MIAEALIISILIVFFYLYILLKWHCSVFDKYDIKYIKPYPIFGNYAGVMFRKRHVMDIFKASYDSFPDDKYVGIFEMINPVILLRDPDLIRDVSIKNFNHFEDHRLEMNHSVNVFASSLPCLRGEKWKEMRATISPIFTSNKLRSMFDFMNTSAKQMVQHFDKHIADGNDTKEIEAIDVFLRFASDVIASTAFGEEMDSFAEPDNEFYRMGMLVSAVPSVRMVLFCSFPRLLSFLKVSFLPKKPSDFFAAFIRKTLDSRDKDAIYRNDLIQLLCEARKGGLKSVTEDEEGYFTPDHIYNSKVSTKKIWTNFELTAQALFFYIAGADASSTTATYLLHILATKPHIQKRLRDEVDQTVKDNEGNMSFDILNKMEYLDMVICEALRLWTTIGGSTERLCTKDYTLPPPRDGLNESYTIKKGSAIYLSAVSLHMNPKYWKNPHEFDPERFSAKNRKKIIPGTYFPFGFGPRNCLGSRYALVLLKLFVFHLIANFELVRCSKTTDDLKYDPWNLTVRFEGGIWIGLRKKNTRDKSKDN